MATDRRLTPNQEIAVRTTGCNMLVSAAAGTGKTHVLAERCAYLTCDAHPPCDVDRMLVVTFTEAAAAEMRARIGQVIRRHLDAQPLSARLQRQLVLLDAARITTIHAFCLHIVRRWFARLDLDPNLEVMDEDEAELTRRETIEQLFRDLYGVGGKSPLADGFRRLVDTYGMGRDERIAVMVLNLHAVTQSIANPSRWLEEARRRVDPGESSDALSAHWEALRRDFLLDRIHQVGNAAVLQAACVRQLYPHAADIGGHLEEMAEDLRTWYRSLKSAKTSSEVDRTVEEIAQYSKKPAAARRLSETSKQEREAAQTALRSVRRKLDTDLKRSAAVFLRRNIVEGLRRIGPHVATLTHLVDAFETRYARLKQAEGRVDFNDLERLAFRLLIADENGHTPSQTALRLQAEFDHVLIDEFQDVNPVQDAILRLVSRHAAPHEPGNLFAVGDVKQSIYRFRLAEPRIFVERLMAYDASNKPEGAPTSSQRGKVVWLQENFRSRSEVLDAVNAVFERLMIRELGGITYDEHARLKPCAEYPKDTGNTFACPAVEIHLIEKDIQPTSASLSYEVDAESAEGSPREEAEPADTALQYEAVEREAMLTGRRILELLGRTEGCAPMTVFEKNPNPMGPSLVGRPIRPRDIVILLRATRDKANHFERILRDMDIPVHADMTTGYFASLEVRDGLSLLRLIDNARQDIPLAAVLRSPLLGDPLSEDQLVEIRLSNRQMPFHQAVRQYRESGPDKTIRRRLTDLYARLDAWRHELRCEPLPDVLWRILIETGYWAYVGGLRNGLQRRANLLRLHDRARQFSTFAKQGLRRFLRFFEQLSEEGRDPGLAAALSEADDVVRIMSIHRSKGLEFPVVILPDLGKRFNLADTQNTLLFERERYVGLPVVDLELGVRYPTLASLIVADEIGRQIRAEEMRVLYVAMTRAREHIILIGTIALNDVERRLQTAQAYSGQVPLVDLLGAKSMLDWLISAVTMLPAGLSLWSKGPRPEPDTRALFSIHQHNAAAIAEWPSPEQDIHANSASLRKHADLAPVAEAEPDDPEVHEVIARITKPYAHSHLTNIPAVMAASEMKRRFAFDREVGERPPYSPFSRTTLRSPRLAEDRSSNPLPLTAAEQGTLIHLILQHLDLGRPCDLVDIARQVEEMANRGLLTHDERRCLPLEPLAWLFSTDLGRRLLGSADRIRREVPFVLGVPPHRIAPGQVPATSEADVVLVRGMIDCLLPVDEEFEVVDFKTDAIGQDTLPDRIALYRPQIDIYAEAVLRIWRRPVKHRWLVFLMLPQIVQV